MTVQISSIRINHYRSCYRTHFEPHPELSALIGANGAGKSNVLNAIALLSRALRQTRLPREEFLSSVSTIRLTLKLDTKTVKADVSLKYVTSERNADEVLESRLKWDFSDVLGVPARLNLPLPLILDWAQTEPRGEQAPLFDVLPRITHFRRFRKELDSLTGLPRTKLYGPAKDIFDFLRGISYYSASQFTDPSSCPTYFEIERESSRPVSVGARQLVRRQRSEHAQFMQDLYLTYTNDRRAFDEYLSIVGKSGIGLVNGIKYREVRAPSRQFEVFVGGQLRRKEARTYLVIPTFDVARVKLSPNQLSEGTFKTLALLFYLITDKSKLLLIEEPEVCVHHGLLASILELIRDFSREKQIIISTHSDYVLDSLRPENVFVVRRNADEGTEVRSVTKAMSKNQYTALKEYLENVGNLGEYWRHGELE